MWKLKRTNCATTISLLTGRTMASLFQSYARASESEETSLMSSIKSAWLCIWQSLGVCSDTATTVTAAFVPFQWKTTMDNPNGEFTANSFQPKTSVLILLIRWAKSALNWDRNDVCAMKMLQALGSCDNFGPRLLRRTISVDFLALPPAQRLQECINEEREMHHFLNCAVPSPDDREMDILLSCTRERLEVAHNSMCHDQTVLASLNLPNILSGSTVDSSHFVENQHLQKWEETKSWDETKRLEVFEQFLESRVEVRPSEQDSKPRKILFQEYLCGAVDLTCGEMCANCLKLTSQLDRNMRNLDGCSRCKQMKYCRRECQSEHWTKIHKRHCKKS